MFKTVGYISPRRVWMLNIVTLQTGSVPTPFFTFDNKLIDCVRICGLSVASLGNPAEIMCDWSYFHCQAGGSDLISSTVFVAGSRLYRCVRRFSTCLVRCDEKYTSVLKRKPWESLPPPPPSPPPPPLFLGGSHFQLLCGLFLSTREAHAGSDLRLSYLRYRTNQGQGPWC